MNNYLRVGYDPRWLLAHLQAAAGFQSRGQSAGRRRHHGVRRPAAREPERSRPGVSAIHSVKLVANCETLLFQRPDDAIHRGFDKQAEADIAAPGTFLSNFEPLTCEQDAQGWSTTWWSSTSTPSPMKQLLDGLHPRGSRPAYVVSSAHPRMVDGKPSKNPRYLQKRPDLAIPRDTYLAEIATRLAREIPADQPGAFPGQRGALRPPEQSARSRRRAAAAGRLQSDPLSGTARAVHGFHLQPDRQIARRPPDSAAKAR